MIITLDGPCGSGKSTIAQLLASKLGFFYINSGYLYRSLAYILVTEFDYDTQMLYQPNLEHVQIVFDNSNFIYQYQDGIARIFFKGKEITHHLKHSSVSHGASIISAHCAVRQIIVPIQQKFGSMHNLVTDGRDGGTEIYPQADFKFYVTAQADIRAQRLQADLAKNGVEIDFDQALQMTVDRDTRDMNRDVSPLRKADDAILVDTSHQSIHQVLDFILSIVQK